MHGFEARGLVLRLFSLAYAINYMTKYCINRCFFFPFCLEKKLLFSFALTLHVDGRSCTEDEYQCRDTSKCISKIFVCDHHIDCTLHEDDELNCTYENSEPPKPIQCTDSEFECIDDHMCLAMELLCDGIPQCMDGSDETMGCLDIEKKCAKGFLCKNKRCLSNRDWVCDGDNDCGDNSDEEANCGKYYRHFFQNSCFLYTYSDV